MIDGGMDFGGSSSGGSSGMGGMNGGNNGMGGGNGGMGRGPVGRNDTRGAVIGGDGVIEGGDYDDYDGGEEGFLRREDAPVDDGTGINPVIIGVIVAVVVVIGIVLFLIFGLHVFDRQSSGPSEPAYGEYQPYEGGDDWGSEGGVDPSQAPATSSGDGGQVSSIPVAGESGTQVAPAAGGDAGTNAVSDPSAPADLAADPAAAPVDPNAPLVDPATLTTEPAVAAATPAAVPEGSKSLTLSACAATVTEDTYAGDLQVRFEADVTVGSVQCDVWDLPDVTFIESGAALTFGPESGTAFTGAPGETTRVAWLAYVARDVSGARIDVQDGCPVMGTEGVADMIMAEIQRVAAGGAAAAPVATA
jgi:hypothetical protein